MGRDAVIGDVTVVSEKGADFVWLDIFGMPPPSLPKVTSGAARMNVTEVTFSKSVAVPEGRVFRFATSPGLTYTLFAP